MIYKRTCPRCNNEISYKIKYVFIRANERGFLCQKCRNSDNAKKHSPLPIGISRIKNQKNEVFHIRLCPCCTNVIIHSGPPINSRNQCTRSLNKKSTCKECYAKNKRGKPALSSEAQRKSTETKRKNNSMAFLQTREYREARSKYAKEHNHGKHFPSQVGTKQTKERIQKRVETRKRNGTYKYTIEQKLKKREWAIKRREEEISRLGSDYKTSYNFDSIPIIESYGKEHGYNFQHAENGGEFKYRGFFADGYDKEHNIWIEYDEKHHFLYGELKKRDLDRQNEIIKYLGCKFIRIKYDGTITFFRNENK